MTTLTDDDIRAADRAACTYLLAVLRNDPEAAQAACEGIPASGVLAQVTAILFGLAAAQRGEGGLTELHDALSLALMEYDAEPGR